MDGTATLQYENGKTAVVATEPRTATALHIVLQEPVAFDVEVALNVQGRASGFHFSSGQRVQQPNDPQRDRSPEAVPKRE